LGYGRGGCSALALRLLALTGLNSLAGRDDRHALLLLDQACCVGCSLKRIEGLRLYDEGAVVVWIVHDRRAGAAKTAVEVEEGL
jgi:hypothetical protein